MRTILISLLAIGMASSWAVAEDAMFRTQLPSPIYFSDPYATPSVESGSASVRADGGAVAIHVEVDGVKESDDIRVAGLPDGLVFDRPSSTISGSVENAATHNVSIDIVRGGEVVASGTLTLTVIPDLAISGLASSYRFATGEDVLIRPILDGDVAAVSWDIHYGDLPVGLTLDGSDGSISGRVTEEAVSDVVLRAVDSFDGDEALSELVFLEFADLEPLVVNAISPTEAKVGSAWSSPTPTTVNGVAPYTYRLIDPATGDDKNPPPGLSFSNGQLSGTFQGEGTYGPYAVEMVDADGRVGVSNGFPITVAVPPPPASSVRPDVSYTSGLMSNGAWREGVIDFGKVISGSSFSGQAVVNDRSNGSGARLRIEYSVLVDGEWDRLISENRNSPNSRFINYGYNIPDVEGRIFKLRIEARPYLSWHDAPTNVGISGPVYR